jgi:hypothetical protein
LERWEGIKQKDAERRAMARQAQGIDEETGEPLEEQTTDEIDWRGCYLPETLKDSVLFTHTQLLSLINRKRELDEERVNLDKAFNEYKRDHN